MAGPATTAEFLDLVQKSQLVDETRLGQYLDKLKTGNSLPAEPGKLAGLMVHDEVLTNFQAEQLLLGRWRRFSLGKYKVLERLGSGGMALVYLCEHKLMRRRVAVKVLPTARAQDPAALERFQREARAVAALDHPNIVHAYDIDQDGELHFLVMEYVDGASLQDIVKKTGPMAVARAVQYIRQATLGLGHAHAKGLVHRDIKPANILVDRGGVVKVLDMGLARFFQDEDDVLTKKYDENVLGTADYLSPEQIEDSHNVDPRADIYSLGATFYFLLTGRAPFGDGTVRQKLTWHLTKEAKPVSAVRPDVPPELSAIIAKMMAKKPAERYPHLGAVAAALAPWSQSPLAAPSDAEMPPRTAALSAGGSVETGAPTVVSKNPAPAAPSTTAQPQPAGAGSLPAAPTIAASSADVVEDAPWLGLAADTDDPSARADTATRPGRRGSSMRLQQARRRRRWVIIGAVAAGLLAATAVVLPILLRSSEPNDVPVPRPTLEVSADPNRPKAFRSIREALRNAQAGDVIELCDARHVETLRVDPGLGATEVVLRAKPGTEVIWSPAGKDRATPLLFLYDAAGFHLDGNGITLDGTLDPKSGATVESLVTVQLRCPGLVLADLQLRGFSKRGIQLINCAGDSVKPVLLDKLKLMGSDKTEAGIYLDALPGFRPAVCAFISIADCQFSGFPEGRDIARRDKSVTGDNVQRPGGWK